MSPRPAHRKPRSLTEPRSLTRSAAAVLVALCAFSAGVRAQETPDGPADVAAVPADLVTLDLATAQQRALQDNPGLQAAAERVAQTRTLVAQARSLYFPQVMLNYSIAYTWLPSYLTDPAQDAIGEARDLLEELRWELRLGSLAGFLSPTRRRTARNLTRDASDFLDRLDDKLDGPLDSYQLSVSGAYLLFDGFSRRFKHTMARTAVKEGEAAHREGQRLLLAAVTRAYHGVQLARENVRIAQADMDFNERLLRDTTVMREHGRAATSDVLNFEVAVRAARTALLSAERDHAAARIALATLMAMPDARLPDGVRVAPLADESPELMEPPDERGALDTALALRPDLERHEHSVDRAGTLVRDRYAAYAPQVGAFVNYQAQRFDSFDLDADDFTTTVGINLSYDVFTGGRRAARVREAKHARREAELQLRDRELTVQGEVQEALLDLRMAQEQLVLQRTTLDKVRQSRDLVARSYEAGREMLARLNQAQRDLVRAESALAAARVQLQQAWHDLHAATGQSLALTAGVQTDDDELRP